MKKLLTTALAISFAALSPAQAEDAHHPEQDAAAAASAPAPEKAIERMRENTATMRSQLDALAVAKTPDERQKLLMQHMQTMRENMMLGQQMAAGPGAPMACHMMGGKGMMGGMMGAGPSGASPEAMAQRMHQMEQRLDMMQMMMERMDAGAAKRPAK